MIHRGPRVYRTGIACVGDSQTAGKPWVTTLASNVSVPVRNFGEASGKVAWALDDGLGTLPPARWQQSHARVVLIKYGLNDVSTSYQAELTAAQRKALFVSDLQRLTGLVLSLGAIPVLMTNIKLSATYYTDAAARNALTEEYDAEKVGLTDHLIDLYARFDTEIGLSNEDNNVGLDDLHYNANGNAIVADEVETYLTANGLVL